MLSPTVAPGIGLPCSSTTRPITFPALGNFNSSSACAAGQIEEDALCSYPGQSG